MRAVGARRSSGDLLDRDTHVILELCACFRSEPEPRKTLATGPDQPGLWSTRGAR